LSATIRKHSQLATIGFGWLLLFSTSAVTFTFVFLLMVLPLGSMRLHTVRLSINKNQKCVRRLTVPPWSTIVMFVRVPMQHAAPRAHLSGANRVQPSHIPRIFFLISGVGFGGDGSGVGGAVVVFGRVGDSINGDNSIGTNSGSSWVASIVGVVFIFRYHSVYFSMTHFFESRSSSCTILDRSCRRCNCNSCGNPSSNTGTCSKF
jgi:hypothetical protein